MERQDLDLPEGAVKPLWIKFPRHTHSTAQAQAAGSDAVLIWLDAACMCFDAGSDDGIIPTNLRPVIGRSLLVYPDWSAGRILAAISACITNGLLIEKDRGVQVKDWRHIRPAKDDSERQAEARDRKRDAASRESHGAVVTSPLPSRAEQSRAENTTTTTEDGGAGGGGGGEQPLLTPTLARHGVFSGSTGKRLALARDLAARGVNEFDIDDLASVAAKKGLDNPSGWLANVLQDAATTAAELGRLRQPIPLYDEAGGALRSDDARSQPMKPEDVGIVWCEVCRGTALGKHWEDHGPVGWRKGDKAPDGWVPPPPSPIPTAKQFKATLRKLADKERKEAQ